MIDRKELNRRVRRLVETTAGYAGGDVRPANQTAGATGAKFATVLIMNVAPALPARHDWANIPDDPQSRVTETVEVHRQFRASIQTFREDALLLANKLCDRITMSSALQLMRGQGLGFVRCGEVRDLSMVVDGSWEERASVDIDFYVVSTETDVVATFGHFPISITTATLSSTTEVNEP